MHLYTTSPNEKSVSTANLEPIKKLPIFVTPSKIELVSEFLLTYSSVCTNCALKEALETVLITRAYTVE